MSMIRWPERMSETGRLDMNLAERARNDGYAKVRDPRMSCSQTVYINLFFDGTNNNDATDNPHRDSLAQSHTNVARLYQVARDLPSDGVSSFYIPGVGTPFPQIGEPEYSTMGKGFASGFGMRVAWGYTRVLNAIYSAITSKILLLDDAAYNASRALTGDKSVEDNLWHRYKSLLDAHKKAPPSKTVRKVWINVFGFSRGAAEARAFVSQLINVWAKDGKIAGEFEYQVNFLGLFDTVASVGPPDSTRATIPLKTLDGHWAWTSDGRLNIPKAVRRTVHYFSIHEQRMSFPLDTLRMGGTYPYLQDRTLEVGYPGVHSDVGGGYPPREQGKAYASDAAKLSQIPLHDMYLEALRCGVPLKLSKDMKKVERENFALDPDLITTFNAWLSTVPSIQSVEDAMRFGMGQMLSWRTLRARVGTGDYVTKQRFFQRAPEGNASREQVRQETKRLNADDLTIKRLEHQKQDANVARNGIAMAAIGDPGSWLVPRADVQQEWNGYDKQIKQFETAIAREEEANAARAAGVAPSSAKPGNSPDDLVSNDKTDIQEAAEEFRVLLTWLNPTQQNTWRAKLSHKTDLPYVPREPASSLHDPETQILYMKSPDLISRTAAISPFSIYADAVITPRKAMKAFLVRHTSPEAVEVLRKQPAAIRLYDDYIHDSRAWFRVPYFREYVPGGFFWGRLLFVGNDTRVENLGLG